MMHVGVTSSALYKPISWVLLHFLVIDLQFVIRSQFDFALRK